MSLATTQSVKLHWSNPTAEITWEFDHPAMHIPQHRRGIAAVLHGLPEIKWVYFDSECISFKLTDTVVSGDYKAAIDEIAQVIDDYLSRII